MAFEPAPLLIGLREGLEALLVLGIVLGMLDRLGARDRRRLVWAGFGAGVAASIVLGIALQNTVAAWFQEQGGAALFEIVVALVAVAVLTYMVLWMQRHAAAMTAGLKDQVARAVRDRQAWVLAFLGFITVLREGIEVVLFYSALSSTIGWGDLILWGAVGFAASALIAAAVFRLTVRVDLRRFFAVTGVLLLFIAAGLLVHAVHAAAELGWIGHGTPLWDTSGALPDEDHWLGGPLHAFLGYEDQPTLLQLLLYVGYLVGFGGLYLAGLRAPDGRPAARRRVAFGLVALLAVFAVAGAIPAPGSSAAGHNGDLRAEGAAYDHGVLTADARRLLDAEDVTVGLLLRSHGEPQHYNASTYASFKAFIRDIWPYTGLPPELLLVDAGTYSLDDAHPFSSDVHADAELVDAWLRPLALPAVPVGADPLGIGHLSGVSEGSLHFTPGAGPGMGEGDLFEIFGLGAYRTWLKMDNFSPKYQQTEDHFAWLDVHLRKHFGDRVVAVYAHSIDPHMAPERSLPVAVEQLVAAKPDIILDAYHSSVHSDAMDTCMMRPHAQHLLREAGFDGRIVQVGMAGTHPAWGEAVAQYLAGRMDHVPDGEPVSVYLAQHGGDPSSQNPCGGGADQYHANAAAESEVARAAIEDRFGDRFTVRQVYGQGAQDADDGVLSPMEALAADRDAGVRRVIVIPYEFWTDAMDALVPLREAFGFTHDQAPYYDAAYETHTTQDGMHVDIWSAHYGVDGKGTAQLARVSEAIVPAVGGSD